MESRNRNPLQKGGAGKFRICRTRAKGFRQMKKSGDKYFRTMISHKIISEQILSINFIWQILSGNYHPRARREGIIFGFHRKFQPKMLKALQICILKHQHFIKSKVCRIKTQSCNLKRKIRKTRINAGTRSTLSKRPNFIINFRAWCVYFIHDSFACFEESAGFHQNENWNGYLQVILDPGQQMQFWSWTLRLEQLFFEDESLHFGDCLLPRNNCSRVVQLEGHHGGKVEPLSDVLLAHSITKIKVDINFLQELYVGQHDIFEPECTDI